MLLSFTSKKYVIFSLQSEILRLEFSKKEPDAAGRICERQLAELLLAYADYSPKRRAATLKRVRKTFKASCQKKLSFLILILSYCPYF
jgi:hypothetical protein